MSTTNKEKGSGGVPPTSLSFYIIGNFEETGPRPYYKVMFEMRLRYYFNVFNPVGFLISTRSRENMIKEDLKELLNADAVVILPGWENGKYSDIEMTLAQYLKYKVYAFLGGKLQEIKI